jgi:hypothetical protein
MKKIKLFKKDVCEDGTIRLQSQLYVGGMTADFTLKDGVLKHWSHGKGGLGFHETDTPFEIVDNKKEMARQAL